MRLFIVLSLLMFSFSGVSSFGQTEVAATGTLKQSMKEIDRYYKSIGRSLKDPSKNLENAAAAAQMSSLFKQAKEQLPDLIATLPEAHRAEAATSYQNMILQMIDLTDQLQQAFLANDNARAGEIYLQIKELKREGHDKFDP